MNSKELTEQIAEWIGDEEISEARIANIVWVLAVNDEIRVAFNQAVSAERSRIADAYIMGDEK